jgi:hypothetical protein
LRRPIDEKKLPPILANRLAGSALLAVAYEVLTTPWLLLTVSALALTASVVALVISFVNGRNPMSSLNLK